MSADAEAAPVVLSAGAATDVGTTREHNEDSFLCESPLFLVADGMGGYAAGEVASALVLEEFRAFAGAGSVTVAQMKEAFATAAVKIAALAGDRSGAGTTLSGVGLTVLGGVGYWAVINVGDSRTYRLSGDGLEQISVDHSVVQELVEAGTLTASEARVDRRRNVVTRAIGAGTHSEPDFWLVPIERGDRMVVCSDGLSGEVEDARIADLLRSEPTAQAAAERLVHEALLRGARDNVTVVVVNAEHVAPHGADDVDGDTVPRADADTNANQGSPA